jgi:hypothetical protein
VGDSAVPTPVTHAELAGLVRAEIARGYQTTQEGRRRLLALVEELAPKAPADPVGLLAGRRWRIASITVAGLGGIGSLAPSTLDLTPTCGLTVVRGPNGCGKTSLAKAFEVTLTGTMTNGPTGDLWSAALLTEGAPQATATVVLVSGSNRLEIRTVLDASSAGHVSAVLTDAAGSRAVELGAGWREALLASQACFGYASLRARLQDSKDLQSYLEELLVLGPVWQEVRATLQERAQAAVASEKALRAALRDAKAAEAAVRRRFEEDPRHPAAPPDVLWPTSWYADVDDWLRQNAIGDGGAKDWVVVDDDYERQVDALASALRTAESELVDAEAELDSPGTASVLDHLAALAEASTLETDRCPLCGTETDWRGHASAVLEQVRNRAGQAAVVEAALSDLAVWVERSLMPLLGSGIDGSPVREAQALRTAVLSGGCRPHSHAHRAANTLLSALLSPSHQAWIAELRRSSDAAAEWRRSRSEAASAFAGVWCEHGERARDAGSWAEADKTLDRIQIGIRQHRQDVTTQRLHSALTSMLHDAEIEIRAIEHQGGAKQKRGVDVALTIGGRRASLGMLSSGQRNALLLAPLLMLDDIGPFGFLLVDDPVHALDDLRVDHLARELARLADSHQVVVLTHDPRLEEHLRARRPEVQIVELDREASTQTVRWSSHHTPWESLLAEADQVRDASLSERWLDTASLESVVTGLCRNALDGALRQAAITCAVRRGVAVEEALTALGEQRETRRRVKHVVRLAGGSGRLPRTEHCEVTHLSDWNRGTHGEPAAGIDLKVNIRAAREACAELTAYAW